MKIEKYLCDICLEPITDPTTITPIGIPKMLSGGSSVSRGIMVKDPVRQVETTLIISEICRPCYNALDEIVVRAQKEAIITRISFPAAIERRKKLNDPIN